MTEEALRGVEEVVFSQCWEDPDIDREAFAIGPNDTVFSITSAGCNTLAFLIDNPREVYSLALIPSQNFLLDLKMSAFAALGYGELLELMGVRSSRRRDRLYRRVRPALTDASRRYWDARPMKIEGGIIHLGRCERYLRLLRRVNGLLVGKHLVQDIFAADDLSERLRLYRQRWDTNGWRIFTRVFLSDTFRKVFVTKEPASSFEGPCSRGIYFLELVEDALTRVSLRDNYFASYILLGRYFDEDHLPPYLMREHFALIRARLPRVHNLSCNCMEFFKRLPPSSIQKFCFSHFFQSMEPEAMANVLREVWRVGSHNAVITYRNQLVPREHPPSLNEMIQPDHLLAHALRARDRSFMHRTYVIERVNKRMTTPQRFDSDPKGRIFGRSSSAPGTKNRDATIRRLSPAAGSY